MTRRYDVPPIAPRPRAAVWAVAFALAVATFLLYAPVLSFGFIRYDDPHYVLLSSRVSQGLNWGNVRWALAAFEVGNWHPLTLISHMMDVSLFGMRAGGHHAVNALLHAMNAMVLFLLLDSATHRSTPSLAVAVLFAVHPLNVESVAWISQRKSVLCMLFLLLTLTAYVAWARRGGRMRYALVVVFCAAALAAKPIAVVLPGLLLLLDFWPLGRLPALRLVLEKLPFAALAAAASLATWAAQKQGGAVGSFQDHPAISRLARTAFAYAWYLFRMVWPTNLSLFYPTTLGASAALKVAGSVVILTAATVVALTFRRTKPYLVFGWAWYATALLPVAGLVNFGTQIVADRYAYLALIGPFVALAFLGAELLEGRTAGIRRTAGAAVALIAIALAFETGFALAPWRDSLSILERGFARAPDNVHAVANLGLEMVKRERFEEGIALLTRAAAERPLYTTVHAYLGYAYARTGRLEHARAAYETAALQRPEDARVVTELGQVLSELKRTGEAEARFRDAMSSDPGYGEAWLALGALLNANGRFAEAEPILARAAALLPGDARPLTARGTSLAGVGRNVEAVASLRNALALDPAFAPAKAELERILR